MSDFVIVRHTWHNTTCLDLFFGDVHYKTSQLHCVYLFLSCSFQAFYTSIKTHRNKYNSGMSTWNYWVVYQCLKEEGNYLISVRKKQRKQSGLPVYWRITTLRNALVILIIFYLKLQCFAVMDPSKTEASGPCAANE